MNSSPGVGQALNTSIAGARRFELIVQDYFGNESRANYLLKVDKPVTSTIRASMSMPRLSILVIGSGTRTGSP